MQRFFILYFIFYFVKFINDLVINSAFNVLFSHIQNLILERHSLLTSFLTIMYFALWWRCRPAMFSHATFHINIFQQSTVKGLLCLISDECLFSQVRRQDITVWALSKTTTATTRRNALRVLKNYPICPKYTFVNFLYMNSTFTPDICPKCQNKTLWGSWFLKFFIINVRKLIIKCSFYKSTHLIHFDIITLKL